MKHRRMLSTVVVTCCVAGVAHSDEVDTRRLVLVEENHASLVIDQVAYTLDSYIVLFQQPYYVKVRRDDNQPMKLDDAAKVAEEYIRPRGCTAPTSRRKDLDRSNRDGSQWLIGILC